MENGSVALSCLKHMYVKTFGIQRNNIANRNICELSYLYQSCNLYSSPEINLNVRVEVRVDANLDG